jgi:chromate transporter
METMRNHKALSAALSAITAAVVGVILNLAVWFALHVLFAEAQQVRAYGMTFDLPMLSTVNVAALVLTIAAMIAVFRFKVGMIKIIAACSIAGLLYGVLAGAI